MLVFLLKLWTWLVVFCQEFTKNARFWHMIGAPSRSERGGIELTVHQRTTSDNQDLLTQHGKYVEMTKIST